MSHDASPRGDVAPAILTEYVDDDWGVFVRSRAALESFRSDFQDVEVHDSVAFGKLFRLDGHFMTSEKDEFFYHENLVHIAALAHPAPERALIVGGGDGGSAEELLKHPSMRHITIAEIDGAVVDISRRHFHAVHKGALDDPRVSVRIEDGFRFVENTRDEYDLIVLDLTDPGGPSTALYTAPFYKAFPRFLRFLDVYRRVVRPEVLTELARHEQRQQVAILRNEEDVQRFLTGVKAQRAPLGESSLT